MEKAVTWLIKHGAAGLFLDPGLRKTSITLAAIKILKRRKLATKFLVIAPLRPCYLVWPAERKKWTDFAGLTMEILHGPDKAAALEREADIYVINPDGLEWLTRAKTPPGGSTPKVDMKWWRSLGFDVLIVDELTMFKNTQTKRFKMMRQILPTFSRRWGLTGSPAANSLLDLFGQCFVLDLGNALGQYITHYRLKYFWQPAGKDSFKWVVQPETEEAIYDRLAPLALRMAAEDYIQIPSMTENLIRIDLPDSARAFYDELEDELIAVIDDTTVIATSVAVGVNKCRQIAGGAVYAMDLPKDEDNHPGVKSHQGRKGITRDWRLVHDAKLDALEELIESLQGQPLIVAYEFQHELERILARIGIDTPVLGGGVSMKRSAEIEQAWNRDEIPVLLVHPQAAGHGLNLQGGSAKHICWFTLPWDNELYDQVNRRIRRSGSKASVVFVHQLVMNQTIDVAVLYALRAKDRVQSSLFKYLKEMRRGRR